MVVTSASSVHIEEVNFQIGTQRVIIPAKKPKFKDLLATVANAPQRSVM